MKKYIILLLIIVAFSACDSGSSYLDDGGLSIPNTGTTTMEFFKSHSQLDTLAILLERAGLGDEVNGETTIFAINNLSIKNYVNAVLTELREEDATAEYTINDIPVDTLTKYLPGYIFNEKIKRENLLVGQGEIYTTINGEERRISLEQEEDAYSDILQNDPEYVYFTYKVGNDWDDWDVTVDDTSEQDNKNLVRTSNIQSTNGIIHVLQGTHTPFGYE